MTRPEPSTETTTPLPDPPQETPAAAGLLSVVVDDSDPRGVVVTVLGEVDMHTGGVLRRAIDSVLAGSPRVIMLDLGAVDFFSSVGLSTLVDLRRAADLRQIALRLVADGRAVLRPLAAVGLAEHFSWYATVPEGLDRPAGRG